MSESFPGYPKRAAQVEIIADFASPERRALFENLLRASYRIAMKSGRYDIVAEIEQHALALNGLQTPEHHEAAKKGFVPAAIDIFFDADL